MTISTCTRSKILTRDSTPTTARYTPTPRLFFRAEQPERLSDRRNVRKTAAIGLPVPAAFVEEVNVFDEQREERYDHPLPLVRGAGAPPQRGLQRGPVAAEVRRRVHVLFQYGELGRLLHLVPLSTPTKHGIKHKKRSFYSKISRTSVCDGD